MEKNENSEVKKYLINTTSQILDNCELFTRVFGKNFAKESLERNLNAVYTNGEKEVYDYYYDWENNTISMHGDLSPEDFEKDEILKYKALHEGCHAVLRKSDEECKGNGTKAEIGMCIIPNSDNEKEETIGLGLNEGLDVWILEKAGLPPRNSKILTNFIRLLELQVGEENIMRLGKGDIEENIPNQLHMTKEECVEIMQISDHVFDLEQEINGMDRIIDVLMKYRNKVIDKSEKETQFANASEELKEDEIYNYYINNSLEYKEYLSDKKKVNSLDSQIVYLESISEISKIELRGSIYEFLEKIFQQYFERSINEAGNPKTYILDSEMKKFTRLYELLNETVAIDNIYGEEESYDETKVKRYIDEGYQKLLDKFGKQEISSKNIKDIIKGIDEKYLQEEGIDKKCSGRRKNNRARDFRKRIVDAFRLPPEEEIGDEIEMKAEFEKEPYDKDEDDDRSI